MVRSTFFGNKAKLKFKLSLFSVVFRITRCRIMRIPESDKFLLLQSGILGLGIWNSVQGIWDRANNWNAESKIH